VFVFICWRIRYQNLIDLFKKGKSQGGNNIAEVFLEKRKEPRWKEYCRIFFKKMKDLSGENIAEY